MNPDVSAVVRGEIVRREYSIMLNLRQQVAKRLDDQSIAALRVQSGELYVTSLLSYHDIVNDIVCCGCFCWQEI